MKKYYISIVVLVLILFMFPGSYLKYSITNKLPKEKYNLIYIKPTLKELDMNLGSGKKYNIGDLFFRIKENVVSYDLKSGPNNELLGVMYIENGKSIIASTVKNNNENLEYISSLIPDDIKIFDSRYNSRLKYELLLDKALLFPNINSKIFNLFKADKFFVIQNSSDSYTTTSLCVFNGKVSFQIILKDFNQDQIDELIASFSI